MNLKKKKPTIVGSAKSSIASCYVGCILSRDTQRSCWSSNVRRSDPFTQRLSALGDLEDRQHTLKVTALQIHSHGMISVGACCWSGTTKWRNLRPNLMLIVFCPHCASQTVLYSFCEKTQGNFLGWAAKELFLTFPLLSLSWAIMRKHDATSCDFASFYRTNSTTSGFPFSVHFWFSFLSYHSLLILNFFVIFVNPDGPEKSASDGDWAAVGLFSVPSPASSLVMSVGYRALMVGAILTGSWIFMQWREGVGIRDSFVCQNKNGCFRNIFFSKFETFQDLLTLNSTFVTMSGQKRRIRWPPSCKVNMFIPTQKRLINKQSSGKMHNRCPNTDSNGRQSIDTQLIGFSWH